MSEQKLVAGIDPGVNTGLAIWDLERQKLTDCDTVSIVAAMSRLQNLISARLLRSVCIEDARLRTWFGSRGKEALMGAGSIKRDCSVWVEWAELYGVPMRSISPKEKGPKIDDALFRRMFGWDKRTSEHARDAAVIASIEAKRSTHIALKERAYAKP